MGGEGGGIRTAAAVGDAEANEHSVTGAISRSPRQHLAAAPKFIIFNTNSIIFIKYFIILMQNLTPCVRASGMINTSLTDRSRRKQSVQNCGGRCDPKHDC